MSNLSEQRPIAPLSSDQYLAPHEARNDLSEFTIDDNEDIFDGPAGVFNGVAREISGKVRVTQHGDEYSVRGTRFDEIKTHDLHDIVITSGRAVVDIDDATTEEPLSIHRVSGYTDLSCGNRTAIIVSGHSGFNNLDGFIDSGMYTAPNGASYRIVVPEGCTLQDNSWVNRIVRVDQKSGFINITKRVPELDKRTIATSQVGRLTAQQHKLPSSGPKALEY